MQRLPEPELMGDDAQALAYAEADFSEPHNHFVALFREAFPGLGLTTGHALDLGCGPADVLIRFARAFPACRLDGVDGAPAMLRYGREALERAGLTGRVRLIEGYLPGAAPPETAYEAVISNSLLHHLADPAVLWESVKRWGQPGAAVFVMDLRRPDSPEQAAALVRQHAAAAPDVLRWDFHHSLLAAYRADEVREQLRGADLDGLNIREIGDRHLIVWGRLPNLIPPFACSQSPASLLLS
ncbi:class I SAM-dependent methyltransferase [Methylomagnum sp.]